MVIQKKNNKLGNVHKCSRVTRCTISENRECDEEENNCPICYDKIENNNYIVTKCNHTFCNDCLFKSLKNGSKCPLCREEIFNFEKIKSLNDSDIIQMEINSMPLRIPLVIETTDSLIDIIEYSLQNNKYTLIDNEVKEMLNNYFRSSNFQIMLKNMFLSLLTSTFRIMSINNYHSLYDWLRK